MPTSEAVFKVWAIVERCDDEADEYTDLGEPELLGTFTDEAAAYDFAASLPSHGEEPKP